MLRRVVAELFTVAKLDWRQTMNPMPRFRRLDDGRQVVGITVDGHAAFDNRERQPFSLQVAIIDGNQRGELRTAE